MVFYEEAPTFEGRCLWLIVCFVNLYPNRPNLVGHPKYHLARIYLLHRRCLRAEGLGLWVGCRYLDSENWKGSVEYENDEFQHLGSASTNPRLVISVNFALYIIWNFDSGGVKVNYPV